MLFRSLADDAREVLQGRRTVLLRKEPPRGRGRSREREPRRGTIDLAAEDQPLFDALRALRTRLASEQSVPPYVIFHDATLREIAAMRPATERELGGISGIGSGKLERYGGMVLETVAAAVAA